MNVLKRDGSLQEFSSKKLYSAIYKCFESTNSFNTFDRDYTNYPTVVLNEVEKAFVSTDTIPVEDIQNKVEEVLMSKGFYKEAKAYILYRADHTELRLIKDRIDYLNEYQNSKDNAASSSETDANANVQVKNVANQDGECYKSFNRKIQRYRMTSKLKELFPEVADQYVKDLEHHIIYTHDEASAPTIKNYCEAVSLYPLLANSTSGMDGLSTTEPKHLSSFAGQLVNLTFLLSSQCKGAVAISELFNFIEYFCVKDFGEDFHKRYDEVVSLLPKKTIKESIEQSFKQIVYGWNQPAGNRSYQSPFTNISYYDENYWKALFSDFYFPDGTQPQWERVSHLQKHFMRWFNEERTKTLLTFPVETMALLTDGNDVIDKDYKNFTAEMYSKGHSFFTYISSNPNALASCCRLRSEISENEFSFTSGLTGVQTGSANVITINLNRFTQDAFKAMNLTREDANAFLNDDNLLCIYQARLESLLERIYKYQIAFKTMLYEVEDAGMLTASNEGYIKMSKLFLTIGVNGFNEAAEFLGIDCNYNQKYSFFCNFILNIIHSENVKHSSNKFRFNTEFVPAEGLSSKNYNWDKQDGYWVPEERNLYNSYFFIPSDENISVTEKMQLHGEEFTKHLDGGVGCHLNLHDHLTKEQYLLLIDHAIKVGCSYFTFNIPNTQCDDCGFITKHPIKKCPKCGSEHTTQWTRIVGFLKPIKNFDKYRQAEALTRFYQ